MSSDKKITFPENKVLEWVIIGLSVVLIGLGLLAPFFVFNTGAPLAEWGLLSWEPYTVLLSAIIYIIVAERVWKRLKGK